jgi:hypothetical protein
MARRGPVGDFKADATTAAIGFNEMTRQAASRVARPSGPMHR